MERVSFRCGPIIGFALFSAVISCGGKVSGGPGDGTDQLGHGQGGATGAGGSGASAGSGGCGGEAAAGGFIAAATDGPTNPDNPYADAVDPGAWLPCAAIGFYENQSFCRFFQMCQLPCGSASDCPTLSGAPAPDCRKGKFSQNCVLPCTDQSECPTGMTCVLTTIGYDRVCMWGHD